MSERRNKRPTPEAFRDAMQAAADRDPDDTENAHIEADELMAATLRALGFGEGIDIFEEMGKWYA